MPVLAKTEHPFSGVLIAIPQLLCPRVPPPLCYPVSRLLEAVHRQQKNKATRPRTVAMVFTKRPRPSLASHSRPLRHPRFRNHAPADAGQDRHSLLGTLDARTPNDKIARRRARRKNP